jgi:uncharacterized protein YbbC (DUF1343 family)
VNPSPNIRSLSAAALYPGLVLVEGSNLSEGRGTDRPFEWVGAPWIDARAWVDALNTANVRGVRFTPADKAPDSSKFAGQLCHGVSIQILDRLELRPMQLGVTLLETARSLTPGGRAQLQLTPSTFDQLAGTDRLRTDLEAGKSAADIATGWESDLQRFRTRRARYLLY